MMEMPANKCRKVKYQQLENAVRDLNLGREFFTRKSKDTLIKVDTPEGIKRYFYDLYVHK